MEAPPWAGLFTQSDLAAYSAAGYGAAPGFAGSPALLLVDVTNEFVGRVGASDNAPNSCPDTARPAVLRMQELLETARGARVPVVYAVDTSGAEPDGGVWRNSRTATGRRHAGWSEVVEELRPRSDELQIEKSCPSAFFQTRLSSELRARAVTDLVICGGTTSGCVRATVVDAFSHGYAVAVPAEAVFDRSGTAHALNLFDMHQKYAQVVQPDQALALLGPVTSVHP